MESAVERSVGVLWSGITAPRTVCVMGVSVSLRFNKQLRRRVWTSSSGPPYSALNPVVAGSVANYRFGPIHDSFFLSVYLSCTPPTATLGLDVSWKQLVERRPSPDSLVHAHYMEIIPLGPTGAQARDFAAGPQTHERLRSLQTFSNQEPPRTNIRRTSASLPGVTFFAVLRLFKWCDIRYHMVGVLTESSQCRFVAPRCSYG